MNAPQRGKWFRMKSKAVWRKKGLSFEAKGLWHIIESFANMDGSNCYPSVEKLMDETGKCKKWVEKYQRELKAKGLIVVNKKKTETGWVNLYDIRYPLTYHYGKVPTEGLPPKMTQGVGSKNDPLPEFSLPEEKESPVIREEPAIRVLPDPPKAATG